MFYLDNSETSWLVYADWLEDQDIDATHIRQEVVEPTTTNWSWVEPYKHQVGTHFSMVGCIDSFVGGYNGYHCVGDIGGSEVGSMNSGVGQF